MAPTWALLWLLQHRATVLDVSPPPSPPPGVQPLGEFLAPWLPRAPDACLFVVTEGDALRPLLAELMRTWALDVARVLLDPVAADPPPLTSAASSCDGGSFVVMSEGRRRPDGFYPTLMYVADRTLFALTNYHRYKLLVLLDDATADLVAPDLWTDLRLRGADVALTAVRWTLGGGAGSGVQVTRELFKPKPKLVSRALNVAYQDFAPFYYDTNRTSGAIPPRTGTEYYLLRALGSRLGLRVQWEDSYDYGLRLPNGSYVGDLLWLVEGDVDVAGLPRYVDTSPFALVDYTYPHAQDNYCFLVRRARAAPPQALLPATFPPLMWLCTLVTLAGLGAAALVAVVALPPPRDAAGALLHVFRAFVTGTLGGAVARRSAALSVVSVATLLLNLVVPSAFQSSLYSVIATARPLRELDTLRELAAAAAPIYIHKEMVGRFRDDALAHLFRVFETQEEFDDALSLVGGGDAALLSYDSYNRLLQRTRGGTMHRPRECLLQPAYVAYPVSRKLTARRLDPLISSATAAGLLDKWTRDTWYELELTQELTPLPPPGGRPRPATPRPLVLAHFQLGLWFLAGGFGTALASFLLEVLSCRWRYATHVTPFMH